MGSTKSSRVFVFCDGSTGAIEQGRAASASRNELLVNCGAAAVAYAADGRLLGWEIQALPRLTNNEAEYAGLLLGIGLAVRLGCEDPVFVLDSETVAGQMAGRCAVNSAGLRRWHWRAVEALRSLPRAQFCIIPREWNRSADGLAAQAGLSWQALHSRLARQLRPAEEPDASKRA